GITTVKGIGLHMATLITDKTGINRHMKVGDLSDAQIEKLQSAIDSISSSAPAWMLNHRKDYDSGENIHLIGNEIDIRLRDEINIMKKIRSYKGIRHERGLPVRGQRTKSNNRKGLALGVSKKKEAPTSSKAKGE
ncbi:MAG: 30S ribosomal protein S13, partial [Candidatus Thermoplasmatota archaeon]|nr:30S ribosomal protein S13 [Candidatus Thermoplasmatota archaeon]